MFYVTKYHSMLHTQFKMYIGEKVSMDSFARHNLFCHVFQSFDDMRSLVALPVLRLDEGKRQFDRRWGYEALDCILENTLHHFNIGRLFHRVCQGVKHKQDLVTVSFGCFLAFKLVLLVHSFAMTYNNFVCGYKLLSYTILGLYTSFKKKTICYMYNDVKQYFHHHDIKLYTQSFKSIILIYMHEK